MDHSEASAAAAPWSVRMFAAIPIAPAWTGVALAALLLAAFFGAEQVRGQLAAVASGTTGHHISAHFRSISINSLLLAYLPTAVVYLGRSLRANVEALRPLLRSPGSADAALQEDRRAVGSRRLAGLAGIALLFCAFIVPRGVARMYAQPGYWVFEHTWENLMLIPMGWLAGILVYTIVVDALRISRLASQLKPLDLFDLSPLFPFVRQGLHSALIAILAISLVMGHFGNAFVPAIGIVVTAVAVTTVATLSLLLPVRGVHLCIRQEKQRKLDELRGAIRRSETIALEGHGERDHAAGLLALEARIQSVREWPFDASSLARFLLYLGLGLGSWIGGATVERLLDRLLS